MGKLTNKLIISPDDEHLAKELVEKLLENGFCKKLPTIEVSDKCEIEKAFYINDEGTQIVIKINNRSK